MGGALIRFCSSLRASLSQAVRTHYHPDSSASLVREPMRTISALTEFPQILESVETAARHSRGRVLLRHSVPSEERAAWFPWRLYRNSVLKPLRLRRNLAAPLVGR